MTARPPVEENVDYFVTKYESECLDRLFGYQFAKAFREGLEQPAPEQRWIDLRDGKEYTFHSQLFKWIGFQNAQKESIIANYVYYQYVYDQLTQTVGIGEVATKAENAAKSSPIDKAVRAWNEMVNWIGNLHGYLNANRDVYPEYQVRHSYEYFWPKGAWCGCVDKLFGCCCYQEKPFFRYKNTLGL